jgi:hypothetical protein
LEIRKKFKNIRYEKSISWFIDILYRRHYRFRFLCIQTDELERSLQLQADTEAYSSTVALRVEIEIEEFELLR